MTYFAITAQYPIFAEADGTPLENGYVYIGQEGSNPITSPITVYWDDALLYPCAQPIRTLAGAPNRNGSPGQLYCSTSFSILVQDKNHNQIYYAKNGNKNFTDNSIKSRTNYIMNGQFEVNQRLASPDRWQQDVVGYTMTDTWTTLYYDQEILPDTPKYFISLRSIHAGSPAATDYARYVQVIEDFTMLAGDVVTLSFYARSPSTSNARFISTSFNSVSSFSPYTAYVEGIAPTLHALTSEFRLYTVTTTIPRIIGKAYEVVVDTSDTGIMVNFWLTAGSNFDSETNSLGFQGGTLDIANVRLNKGGSVDTSDKRLFAEELELCQRYYEKSYDLLVPPGNSKNNGSIVFRASAVDLDIPGPQFKTRKRTDSPTVAVYSPDIEDQVDKVYLLGTGQIAVDTYVWPNETGLALVELAVNTVDGGLYQYHYTVDDEFSL